MIRLATPADIDAVVAIYNQAVDARFQTAFTERMTTEDRAPWFNGHLNHDYPIFVYVLDEQVVGWLTIGAYRGGRAALKFTVEVSYYIDANYQRRGIGSQLLNFGINACRQIGYKTALAIILDRNEASIKLMEKFGFEKWGTLPDVAEFDDDICGQVIYGLKLE